MKKICVIEDDETLSRGLRFDLEAENYFVNTASTVEQSMKEIKFKDFDLIVLDVNLPDGNGFELCSQIKEIKDIPIIFLTACDMETETLMAKLQIKLKRLYEIMKNNSKQNMNEKMVIQSLVSDISHQTKTPIANIKMYSSILQERSMSLEKQQEFLKSADIQINKLDFLMQSMIKMSRLETGVFEISPQYVPIYDTLAEALGGILINAEKKNIYVTVDCEPSLIVNHDSKWTSEALFNILDNAVKYTHEGGRISVTVTTLEFYTKIDIKDNGKGISEKYQAEIFKRFYREADVHDQEGIGIGLYLAREIITMQNGYIQVKSKPQYGSTFSVFIPN